MFLLVTTKYKQYSTKEWIKEMADQSWSPKSIDLYMKEKLLKIHWKHSQNKYAQLKVRVQRLKNHIKDVINCSCGR